MTGLMLVGIAIVWFACAYLFYGRWLAKSWGIDPNAKTPAVRHNDGQDYVPASRFTVFAHQFSSITGAGPVTGPIIAAMFGWLPALLWILIGGAFFGCVQDFTALYASVKNEGKSMGLLIEQYVGQTGRRLFLLFCWLFTLLVIAAFADIIAKTFNGTTAAGAPNLPGAQAATISLLYIVVAMGFGVYIKKFNPKGVVKFLVAVVLICLMFAIGMNAPIFLGVPEWRYVVFGYCFIAAVLPMWLLMEPRDYLSVFLLLGIVLGGVIGILVANPTLNMPAFVGFEVNGKPLFPILFITIACGAVSGFHSLVSSGTSSKSISNEKDMLPVGYGAMLCECMLGVVALGIACAAASNGVMAKGTPFQIFAGGISTIFTQIFGLPAGFSACFITMCVSALGMTTIDSVARIGRMSLQEMLKPGKGQEAGPVVKFLSNNYVATIFTLIFAYGLCLAGYMNIWPLFGAANQLLSALVLIALAVFLKMTGRKGWMLYVPMVFMFLVTMTALVMSVYGGLTKLSTGKFLIGVDGLQLVIAVALMVLAVLVVKHCGKELITGKPDASVQQNS
jgi:carbon starvation protein